MRANNNGGSLANDQSIGTYTYNNTYPGAIITDSDNSWTATYQRTACDAHVHMGQVYDYLLHQSSYNSYDDNGSSLISDIDNPDMVNKAKWDPRYNMVVYGTPDATHWSWAACLEAVGHEVGHGLLPECAHIIYDLNGETSALEESWCYMLGVACRYFVRNQSPNSDWYHIGEVFNQNGAPEIDMQNPHNTSQPDFYQDPVDWYNITNCTPVQANDYCGAHTNAGVLNKMFYLLSNGGQSGQGHNGVQVQGIGVNNAFRIMWDAAYNEWYYWTDSFMKVRGHCIKSALTNLGHRDWAIQTANAFNAVGVCDQCVYVPGDANNNGYANGIDVQFMTAVLKGLNQPNYVCSMPYRDPITNLMVGGDYDGDCDFDGIDVTYAINY